MEDAPSIKREIKEKVYKAVENAFSGILEKQRPKYQHKLINILQSLSEESPDYIKIKRMIASDYTLKMTEPEGTMLEVLFNIFDNIVSGDYDEVEEIIKRHRLLQ